ncbi:MAG: sugar ABC transporter ATP-binding protein [Synergistaceae bacterium]|nr:sugar ABC transporter ATP-binding protein [Synergistaceae bacterium]MBR0097437.1 sugar ABC transporter ATP-binding protein [Synergistaceae bacterium]MBR0222597.1 sugar ABC transporter ATP-binding protein [Synergistaceae bacterium]
MNDVILNMKNIHKEFPGVKALQGVNFDLRRGEVHALLGENGAGKSTLIKVLAGIYIPEQGEVTVNGESHIMRNVADSQAHGISVIHQELCLVPYLSIAENIFLGRERTAGVFINKAKEAEEAKALLKSLGLEFDPNTLVGELSIAQQQMVEIAKALSVKSDILVMDEPTASLTDKETEVLFGVIRDLKAQGKGIIYISHRMSELFEITDRVTIMRDGQYVGTVNTRETTRDKLIAMMVGRELTQLYVRDEPKPGEVVLEVKDLVDAPMVNGVSFSLRAGEIVGMSGLVGAGRSETAHCIFGISEAKSGEILIDGKPVKIHNVRDAMQNGIAMVPEDRKAEGLVLINSVGYNLTLTVLHEIFKGKPLGDPKREKADIERYIKELAIKTPTPEQLAENLSGGNQQKIVIAKWLATEPKVLILDEPTRGVDVGARAEIYGFMNALAQRGVAILMISSDLPEILNMSDRVLVMYQGRVMANLGKHELSQELIMHYATGVSD